MAKGFSPNFLIGFLLVLVVADTVYVRGECTVGNSVPVKSCPRSNCNSLCTIYSNFPVSHTECRSSICFCCR
ncbi:hypothetical protein MKW92_014294 [Papaver armeniacum]|nr:hypothetical protein MKW92_014294 [Papaver armeniacum]